MTSLLREAFFSSVQEDKGLSALMEERRISRRRFLRQAALTAGGMALVPTWLRAAPRGNAPPRLKAGPLGNAPRIVIIGAGIAGLNACYQLQKHGIASTVYEASPRTGGRMFTMRDQFGESITTDIGGEFVDATHTDIQGLVEELGLSLYDLRDDTLISKTYYFQGSTRSETDLKTALAPFVPRLVSDVHSLPNVISHETADTFRLLDNQSITEYITGIGIKGWLYDYLNVTLTREYGMEASEQSAINFLIMFEPPTDKEYELFGPEHEVFKIKGGSQHLTDALYQRVQQHVILNHRLTALAPGPSGYTLTFGGKEQVQADYVLLAIPFTILRQIDLSIDMPAAKRKCIDEIGYGNSCKFVLGMDGKPWRHAGQKGYTFTDQAFGCGWDSSLHQSETKGGFTVFGGGNFGTDMERKGKDELSAEYVPGLEQIFPGSKAAFTHKTVKFCWSQNPYSLAGYSSFRKGQWSTLAGWEGVPVGNVYFAGEHVSREFQGYMNGGAETARVAVEAMVKQMTKG